MKTVIISCQTIENELRQAMADCHCDYPVRYVESGLHDVPQKLHDAMQQLLDECQDYDRSLVAMGFCGNALADLQTGRLELIIPRADDCITLLLGSAAARAEWNQKIAAFFMTEGWLKGERNIWREYQYAIEKYGEETGRAIYEMMFHHYQAIALLDTGSYDLTPAITETQFIARELGLEHQVIPASVEFIRRLLSGPWPEEAFVCIPPGQSVAVGDLTLRL